MKFLKRLLLCFTIMGVSFAENPETSCKNGLTGLSIRGGASHADTSQENHVGRLTLMREHDDQSHSVEIEAFLDSQWEKLPDDGGLFLDFFTPSFRDRRIRIFGVGVRNTTVERGRLSFFNSLGLGYGWMDWKLDPLNKVVKRDQQAKSLVFTGKLGVRYKIREGLALEGVYRLDRYKFDTKLSASGAVSELEDNGTSSFLVGLNFKFTGRLLQYGKVK